MDDNALTTPMDASELLKCAQCSKGMLHGHNPVFYEVTVRQCVADLRNIGRMHGMEMMTGSVGLARVLSPDNTVAQRIGQPARVLICMDCAMQPGLPAAQLLEQGS
ncbi:hypothetical protein [Mesorhizobium sp. M0058]|uniref:hypothetical protein n=1 Tax=Mesorhizobium sp. M0058 TaxID=2956865 RepID=UPI00333A6201